MHFAALAWEPVDLSHNPELELLRLEDEDTEAEALESFWLAGLAVTRPHSLSDKE